MKKHSIRNRKNAKPALSSVGLAVFATMIAGGAHADIGAHDTGSLAQNQTLTISATANSNDAVLVANPSGVQTNTSNSVTNNGINAVAGGNGATGTIDLVLTSGGNSNLNSSATDSGNVTSTANANQLGVSLNGFQSGNVVTSGNSINATTTVNSTALSIAGVVPIGAAQPVQGTALLSVPNYTDSGNIVVSTFQKVTAPSSSATVQGNQIDIDLSNSGNPGISSSPQLSTNAIGAVFTGNSSSNSADIQSGSLPSFTGSAVVTNSQNFGAANTAALTSGSATSASNRIVASVLDNSTLTGSLGVTGNTITSQATGNNALGNSISLDGALSFTGVSTSDTAYATNTGGQGSGDAVVGNSQQITNAAISSSTQNATIGAVVHDLNGSVLVQSNSATSAATGNLAQNSIANGSGAATFSGVASLQNLQVNNGAAISATTASTDIGTLAGYEGTQLGLTSSASSSSDNVGSSPVKVNKNSSTAVANGNTATQSVVLSAANLAGNNLAVHLDTHNESINPQENHYGQYTVGNLQSNINSSVIATDQGSLIDLAIGTVSNGNALSVTNNTQLATASGTVANNALSVTGNTLSAGAGIVNLQSGDVNSAVSASVQNSSIDLLAGKTVSNTSVLTLSVNQETASAYGNIGVNTLTVTGTPASLPTPNSNYPLIASTVPLAMASTTAVAAVKLEPTVDAAYGVLNSQAINDTVSASTQGAAVIPMAQLGVLVQGDLTTNSTVANTGNASKANALGNYGSSAMTLALGAVSTPDFVAVGNVTNVQGTGTGAAVTASTAVGQVVNTEIDGSITGSSGVKTSGNTISAVAQANAESTMLTVTGVKISTPTTTGSARTGAGTTTFGSGSNQYTDYTTDASFSVQNVQVANGAVKATQIGDGTIPVAASVGVTVGTAGQANSINTSFVEANANQSLATATANSASNSLSISATTAATTAAVQNVQTSNGSVSSFIGLAGTAAANGQNFTFEITGKNASNGPSLVYYQGDGSSVPSQGTLTGADLTATLDSAGSDAKTAAMVALGWTPVSGSNTVFTQPSASYATPTHEILNSDYNTIALVNGQLPKGGTTPATPAIPQQGGVILTLAGSSTAITSAQLSVNSNVTSGAVMGNTASNSLSVAATSLATANGGTAATSNVATGSAQADNALSNVQSTGAGALTSNVYGSFPESVSLINSAG